MKHISEVREKAVTVIEKLESDKISHSKGNVIMKGLNVIVATAKQQLDQIKIAGTAEKLVFLENRV